LFFPSSHSISRRFPPSSALSDMTICSVFVFFQAVRMPHSLQRKSSFPAPLRTFIAFFRSARLTFRPSIASVHAFLLRSFSIELSIDRGSVYPSLLLTPDFYSPFFSPGLALPPSGRGTLAQHPRFDSFYLVLGFLSHNKTTPFFLFPFLLAGWVFQGHIKLVPSLPFN